jgi:excisionase family DNA binding protein
MSDTSLQPDDHKTPRFHSVEEAAAILHVSPMTLYRSINEGGFPAIQIRGRKVVPAKAIDEMETTALETRSLVNAADWVDTASR